MLRRQEYVFVQGELTLSSKREANMILLNYVPIADRHKVPSTRLATSK